MIRWIAPNLGTAARDSVLDSYGAEIVDVRHLVDKAGNGREVTLAVVEGAVALLRQGKRVVVCCDYGISRSNAIAAGVLAVYGNLPFVDAVREVIRCTGEQEIKPEVLSSVEEAIRRDAGQESLAVPENLRHTLITGGSGFIGKRLIDLSKGTFNVVAPGRNELDLTKGSAELALLLKEHRISQLVHLAAPRIYTSNAAIGPILVALKNVIDACRLNHVKIVFVSGWVVYSNYRSQLLLASEGLPADPKGPYGMAKWLCEKMLEHEKSTYGDFDYCTVRLASVYGLGSDRPKFIHRFIDLASRGEAIGTHRYANGLPIVDLIHIDDVVSALRLVIERNLNGSINIGAGVGVSTTAIAEMIIELTNSSSVVRHHEVEDFAPNIVMDVARARKILGWEPKATLRVELSRLVAASANQ